MATSTRTAACAPPGGQVLDELAAAFGEPVILITVSMGLAAGPVVVAGWQLAHRLDAEVRWRS